MGSEGGRHGPLIWCQADPGDLFNLQPQALNIVLPALDLGLVQG